MKHYLHIFGLILSILFAFSFKSMGQVTGNNVKVLDLTGNSYTSGSCFFTKNQTYPLLEVDSFYTIECWLYVSSKPTNDVPRIMDRRTVFSFYLIDPQSSSTGNYRIKFVALNSSNYVIASMTSDGVGTNSIDSPMYVDTWYHVAVSRDGNTARMFVNGALVDESTDSDFKLSTSSGKNINFGAKYTGNSPEYYTWFLTGAVDEYRYSDIARYTSSFSISIFSAPHDTTGDPHTILLYNFDNSDRTNSTSAASSSYETLRHKTLSYIDWDDAGLDQSLPLPVKYIEPLHVEKYNNSQAKLSWATATEDNNDGFEIERSKNGIEWENIGFVKGAGNSILPRYYSFVDMHPLAENYYRLKQIDYDGKFSYSNEAYYSFEENQSCAVFPNPCSSFIQIKGLLPYQKASAIIYNAEGQFIKASPSPSKIDIQELPKGVYFVEIRKFNSQREVLRFIKN